MGDEVESSWNDNEDCENHQLNSSPDMTMRIVLPDDDHEDYVICQCHPDPNVTPIMKQIQPAFLETSRLF